MKRKFLIIAFALLVSRDSSAFAMSPASGSLAGTQAQAIQANSNMQNAINQSALMAQYNTIQACLTAPPGTCPSMINGQGVMMANLPAYTPFPAMQGMQGMQYGGGTPYIPNTQYSGQLTGNDIASYLMQQEQMRQYYTNNNQSNRNKQRVQRNNDSAGDKIFNALALIYMSKQQGSINSANSTKNNVEDISFSQIKTPEDVKKEKVLKDQSKYITITELPENKENNNIYLQVFEKPKIVINPAEPVDGVDITIQILNLKPVPTYKNSVFEKTIELVAMNNKGSMREGQEVVLMTAEQAKEGTQSAYVSITQSHPATGKVFKYIVKVDISIATMTAFLSSGQSSFADNQSNSLEVINGSIAQINLKRDQYISNVNPIDTIGQVRENPTQLPNGSYSFVITNSTNETILHVYTTYNPNVQTNDVVRVTGGLKQLDDGTLTIMDTDIYTVGIIKLDRRTLSESQKKMLKNYNVIKEAPPEDNTEKAPIKYTTVFDTTPPIDSSYNPSNDNNSGYTPPSSSGSVDYSLPPDPVNNSGSERTASRKSRFEEMTNTAIDRKNTSAVNLVKKTVEGLASGELSSELNNY